MKISIIIPVYNMEEYLDICLESLLSQTLNEVEVIFVDDGSTDKSVEKLKTYIEKYNNIRLLCQKHKGVSAARNLGIRHSSGDYITFVDADDYVEYNMYNKLYNMAYENNSDMIICDFYEKYEDKKESVRVLKNVDNYENVLDVVKNEIINKHEYAFCFNKLYKSNIIKNNNIAFNESISICEDLEFNLKYIDRCDKITYLPIPLYNYLIRPTSASRTMTSIKSYNTLKVTYNWCIEYAEKWNLLNQDTNTSLLKTNIKAPYYLIKHNLLEKSNSLSSKIESIKDLKCDEFFLSVIRYGACTKTDLDFITKKLYETIDNDKYNVVIFYLYYIMLKLRGFIKNRG